ncbi:heat shock protein Hsp20 [Galbibacter marinus]|uniref:Heat shock protein Hsp20 n=1 Tax=Galbibacter marinus TaxID=555500 RepID=K2PUJ7_9FLAO|nr:Hsp20/alpha crystallin family protein [Galbibacter marinus]EKF56310.1 heat shock protein Hsp20 [Galbibacter marinus]
MSLVRRNSGFFPSFLDTMAREDWFGGLERLSDTIPAVNIKELEKAFALELAVPGMKKEDFKIELDKDVLTVSAEVSDESKAEQDAQYSRREFKYASFKRVFTLPKAIDKDQINASYTDGVLNLTLPKLEAALPAPKRLVEIA